MTNSQFSIHINILSPKGVICFRLCELCNDFSEVKSHLTKLLHSRKFNDKLRRSSHQGVDMELLLNNSLIQECSINLRLEKHLCAYKIEGISFLIVSLLSMGCTQQQVCDAMRFNNRTLNRYLRSIRTKMKAKTNAHMMEMIAFAINN